MTSDPGFAQVVASLLAVTIRSATPMLIAALGLVFMARSGIVNIGAEGMMLMGALTGVVGSYYSGSAWVGALSAALVGAVLGVLFAYFCVSLGANQMVTGMALNILAMGLTSSFDRVLFGNSPSLPQIAPFKPLAVPLLSRLPVLGPSLFTQMPPVYLALLLVPVAHLILFHTTRGLEIRSVGEHPRAAAAVGISVHKVRYATIVAGSALAGFAGSYMSLGLVNFFAENMVAGRGFIALAAVIFGRYAPVGTLGATLLFGAASALQFRLQASGIAVPQDFLLMLPYILTVAALTRLAGRTSAPAALGRPYTRE